MFNSPLYIIALVVIVAIPVAMALIRATVKIQRQYERAVVFTFGALSGGQGAGPRPVDPHFPGNGAGGFAHTGHRDVPLMKDVPLGVSGMTANGPGEALEIAEPQFAQCKQCLAKPPLVSKEEQTK